MYEQEAEAEEDTNPERVIARGGEARYVRQAMKEAGLVEVRSVGIVVAETNRCCCSGRWWARQWVGQVAVSP